MSFFAVMIVVQVLVYLLNSAAKSPSVARYNLELRWLWVLRAFAACIAFVIFASGGPWWLVAGLVCGFGVPYHFARWVLVPLGIPYVTWLFVRGVHFGGAKPQAIFYELFARHRSGLRVSARHLGPLEQRLDAIMLMAVGTDEPIRGAAIAARAILDVHQGNVASARALFFVVMRMKFRYSSPGTRELAQGWLLADALARGENAELLAISGQGPWTAQRFFFRQIARLRLGLGAGGARVCAHVFGVLCPNPIAARRLARNTRATHPFGLPSVPLGDLQRLRHATLSAIGSPSGSVSRQVLRELARAWDPVLDAGAFGAELRRLAGNDVDDRQVHAAEGQFRTDLQRHFVQLWRCSLPDEVAKDAHESELILSAVEEIGQEHAANLDTLVASLPEGRSRHELQLEERWRTWAAIQREALALEALDADRLQWALESLRNRLINHGAWLFNQQLAHFLAGDVFAWLCERTAEGHGSYELLRNNKRLARR